MTSPRIFIYVQHLLGIGHLVRANRIATALVEDGFDVTVAMGGLPVPGFPGPGVRTVLLPPVQAGRDGLSSLADATGEPIGEPFKAERRKALIEALIACKPDAVLVETFPFGRRQMRFELLPFLDAARKLPGRPPIACSVRDILQDNRKAGRAEETLAAIESYFDLVLVHGDPKFATLDETFPVQGSLVDKIAYTGLVAGPAPPPPTEQFDIVISAGGGAAGLDLMNAASGLRGFGRCCLITGPNLPGRLSPAAGLEVHAFRADFPSLLMRAKLSVSQAGYNTVCDILRAGCRSLLVPFAKGGETEQTARALRLEKLGLADVLPEDGIDAAGLSRAVEGALAKPPPPPHGFNLDGARRTAEILRERLDFPSPKGRRRDPPPEAVGG